MGTSITETTSTRNLNVNYLGAHHLGFVDAFCFLMEYQSNMSRISISLEMALRERKEKTGVMDVPQWKERNSAQSREYINHLREEFLNSAFGQGLLKAKEAVGQAVQKVGNFMSSIDQQFGISDKVNEKVAELKEKTDELRAKAMGELDQLKQKAMEKINENPELKQRLDVMKEKSRIFNDGAFETEIAKLREEIKLKVNEVTTTTIKQGIESILPIIQQSMNNRNESEEADSEATSRQVVLMNYLDCLYESLDTEAIVCIEMETCIAEFTELVQNHGIMAELKIRDVKEASQAERSLRDFKDACCRGATSVKDITAISLEILQDFWSDSTARDSRGKRRSTMADDDVAVGLDQVDDPRVLYMKTRFLRRIADAAHNFYGVMKRACIRLQKLVVATKNVDRTFFFHRRPLRRKLQGLVGQVIFEIQHSQQRDWNAPSVWALTAQVDSALTATSEKCGSVQCTLDGDRVLDVGNLEERDAGATKALISAVANTDLVGGAITKIMCEVQQFAMGVALVIKNQSVMAFQLARLREISIALRPQVLSFNPLPPLKQMMAGFAPIKAVLPSPEPPIPQAPCAWSDYFKGMLGALQTPAGRELDKVAVKLGRPSFPNIPLDPKALPIPLLMDKIALITLRCSLYFGILIERLVTVIIEAIKLFFNIVMMQTSLVTLDMDVDFPDYEDLREALKDIELFSQLQQLARWFQDLFDIAQPFKGLETWNCGGAIKALTPMILLFGFFVVVFVLKKDWLLTLSVGILKLKINASDAKKWFVSRAGKLLGIICLYAVQFVTVSSVGLLFGGIMGAERSCSNLDRLVQVSKLGLVWVGVWVVVLMYLSFFVFVGEPPDPPKWWWFKNKERSIEWSAYQDNHRVMSTVVFLLWSVVCGLSRLIKQTVGFWDADLVDGHRIVSRAETFDDDPNDDDNRHELLVTILGKANAIIWLFVPFFGPIICKFQESMNDPIFMDVDRRFNDESLAILTPRRTRFFKWVGSNAKYVSSLCVVLTATEWSAKFVAASLAIDFVVNFFEDILGANEVILLLTSPPK